MDQGIAEQKRISIRSIKLSSMPRSLIDLATIEYEVHIPVKKYLGMSPDGTKHRFGTEAALEYKGEISIPIDPDKNAEVISAMYTLKCECESILSEILNIPLDPNHPNFKDNNDSNKKEDNV